MSIKKGTKKGTLVVISGPSGVGKGTVLKELFGMSDEFVYSVSATTRAPREGEIEGVNYFYKSREEFTAMIDAGELLEYASYNGNYYGTPRKFVESILETGKNVILEIELAGAMQVKKSQPSAVMIFIAPESKATLLERLRHRGTESEDVIARRIAIAEKELRASPLYDFITVNHDGLAHACAEDILAIVRAERLKVGNCFSELCSFL